MSLASYDWKKAAAQVMDDGSVERAFMDQAYGFLANKAGKLMQDPHRLGFEVVYKNDSNTRMVGIFAFRVNDQILYVPVFFLNGEIKGTDLLYRQETKSFVPLNDEWVTYLTEKNNYEPGSPIDRKEFTRANNHVRFEDIAYPPNYKRDKRASEEEKIQTLGDIDKIIEAAFNKQIPAKAELVEVSDEEAAVDKKLADKRKAVAEGTAKAGGLIRQFITEDGGVEAVAKIASMFEQDYAFAEALVSNLDEKDYMPEDLQVKSAALQEEDKPTLVLFTGRPGKTEHTYLLKQAADESKDPEKSPAINKFADKFFSQGYFLWDDRAPSDLVPVYKDNEENLDLIGSAGMYDILLADGTFRKAIVGPRHSTELGRACTSNSFVQPSSFGSYDGSSYNIGGVIENITYNSTSRSMYPEIVVVFTDGEKESDTCRQVHGKFIKDAAQLVRDGDLEDSMSSGKAYRIFDIESGTISEAFYVKSTEEKDGIKYYEVVPSYGVSNPVRLTHNPDMTENDLSIGFLGQHVGFIPVGVDSFKDESGSNQFAVPGGYKTYYTFYFKRIKETLGNCSSIDSWVTEYVKKASLLYDRDSDTYSWRNGPKDQTEYTDRINMAVKLASAGFHAEAVDEMLDLTKQEGTTNWYYGDPEMQKVAFPITQNRDAIFRTTTDSDFQVNKEYPQSFILRTSKDSLQLPPQVVGDAYDPGMGVKPKEGGSENSGMSKEQLMTMSPEQIAQFASSNQLPNVFEHGLVGSLVQVYDSISMIDKYLPDMEEALDRMGRILFLFYWKPRDFEDAYGADDMANLENQILSNFKSFGSLALDLLKRSKKRKLGNVSMGA